MASKTAQAQADVLISFKLFMDLNHFHVLGDIFLFVYITIDHFVIITSYCDSCLQVTETQLK